MSTNGTTPTPQPRAVEVFQCVCGWRTPVPKARPRLWGFECRCGQRYEVDLTRGDNW